MDNNLVNEIETMIPKGYSPTEIISHSFVEGKLYMKKMNCLKGQFVQTHVHRYDHYSILSKGKAEVIIGEENINNLLEGRPYNSEVKHAGDHILIKAKEYHAVNFLEDSVWTCIHVTDTEHDDIDKELVVDELR